MCFMFFSVSRGDFRFSALCVVLVRFFFAPCVLSSCFNVSDVS